MTKKILVIATHKEASGYGEASRRYIKSLLTTGAEIITRPLILGNTSVINDESIEPFDKIRSKNVDVVLQICPPYLFEKFQEKCCGAFFTETYPLPTSWSLLCNQMDNIIHPSDEQRKWCELSKSYKTKSAVIPIPTDINIYSKEYKIPQYLNDGMFKFYTIGENTHRKNLQGLILAFANTFKKSEPVELIIKTNNPVDINEMMFKANTGNTPRIKQIVSHIPSEEIYAIHKNCDCFVQASFSEGYSIPAFDALMFGKTPIVPNCGGYKQFLNSENSYLIDVRETFCFNGGVVHPELFSIGSKWYEPDLIQLSQKMRFVYENGVDKKMAEIGINGLNNFSYEEVGKKLYGALLDV